MPIMPAWPAWVTQFFVTLTMTLIRNLKHELLRGSFEMKAKEIRKIIDDLEAANATDYDKNLVLQHDILELLLARRRMRDDADKT